MIGIQTVPVVYSGLKELIEYSLDPNSRVGHDEAVALRDFSTAMSDLDYSILQYQLSTRFTDPERAILDVASKILPEACAGKKQVVTGALRNLASGPYVSDWVALSESSISKKACCGKCPKDDLLRNYRR